MSNNREATRVLSAVLLLAACCVVVPAVGPVQAQTDGDDGTPAEEGLQAALVSEFSYDDNILHQKINTTGSRIWFINPRIGFAFQSPGTEVAVQYELGHYQYLDSSVDTNTRHGLTYSLSKNLNKFNKLMLEGARQSAYEARGLNFNEGSNALELGAPTPIDTSSMTLSYQLGADAAKMRVIGSLGTRDTDRDSPLIIDDSRDFEEQLAGLQLLYRVGWRTDLVAEYRTRDIEYARTPVGADGRPRSLDSEEHQQLIGVDLRATAKTTAKVRVGTVKREPRWQAAQWEDAPQVPVLSDVEDPFAAPVPEEGRQVGTGSNSYWELTAVWAPRTYSTFTLSTSVSNREPLNVGNYVRSQQHSLSWMHRWNGWIQTELDLTFGSDDYIGSARQDERQAINMRMLYTFNSLMNLGVGIRRQNLHSSVEVAGFDKTVYYLYFNYADNWGN